MYEYVKTVTGWQLCWGGAALYAGKTVPTPRPMLQVASPLPTSTEREPARVLSA